MNIWDMIYQGCGNKEKDFLASNVEFKKEDKYKYEIKCKGCGYTFFRQRLSKNFEKKFRCGKCMGRFLVKEI